MGMLERLVKAKIDEYLSKYGTDLKNLITRLEVIEFYVYEIYKKECGDQDDNSESEPE